MLCGLRGRIPAKPELAMGSLTRFLYPPFIYVFMYFVHNEDEEQYRRSTARAVKMRKPKVVLVRTRDKNCLERPVSSAPSDSVETTK